MPDLSTFKLERYFDRYEFSAPYLLSCSDCESLHLDELLSLASAEARQLWEELSLGYTESPGHPLLRAEIAASYKGIDPGDVLVMAPEEAIYIFMRTYLSPGDEVVAVAPAYQSLHEVARAVGCRLVLWPLALTPRGWAADLDLLERLLTPQTRLLVLNFPHNPTGCLLSRQEFDAILEMAGRLGITIFSDEMYRLLELDPARRLPAVCEAYGRGISLSGMSKVYGLPGLRIGWLATKMPGLRTRWQQYKDYTTICNSAPGEILALVGLQAREHLVQRSLDIIRPNLALAEAFCARHPALFRWLPPQAGSVAFPQWTGPGPVDQFCQDMVERQGVMIVPGSQFDHPGQHFRVGLGRRSFAEALARVEEGVK
jgi:aspartate/methionine/tyrosine aminotransferase